MKTIITITLFVAFTASAIALELRDEGPKGKDWVKITDIHYMNKASVKRVKGSIYQAKVCNNASNSKLDLWACFDVRVDCSSRQAWSESGNKWIGPMEPANYDEGVMNSICK